MSEWQTVSQPPRWYEVLIARVILADGRPGWWRTLFGSFWKRLAWGCLIGLAGGTAASVLFWPAPLGQPVPADLVVNGKKGAYTLRAPGAHWRIVASADDGTAGDVNLVAAEGQVMVLVNHTTDPEALRETLLEYMRQTHPALTAVPAGPYTRLRFTPEDEGLMRMVATPTTCYTILFLTRTERSAALRATMESTLASFAVL